MAEFNGKLTGESGESVGDTYHSPEVARDAIEILERMVDELVLAQHGHSDMKPLRINGTTSTIKRFRQWWIAPEGVPEEQHLQEMKIAGHTDMLSFTLTNQEGVLVIKAAQLSGVSPKGDNWHARLQFPRHSEAQQDGSSERRVVLDTWSTPLHERKPKQSGSGIPLNAYDITHFVYGRNEYINQETNEDLDYIIDSADEVVSSVLSHY